ncbi:MAG: response regulator [Methanoregula sp.]|uniref:response regulator n=1 Tax=Methanoregula sp. TaxID=2052170 RepID=UPI003BAFCA52
MSKILVVDDEALIAMRLEERLSSLGYTVVGMAASGEDAIDKARSTRPDLVLMDIVMPGRMNGIDSAKIISDELDIPVVFITAYADDEIIKKAKSVRPYGYIVKPINELEIKAAIEVALFRKSEEQDLQKLQKMGRENISTEMVTSQSADESLTYLDITEEKTVLLTDIFTEIGLFLYTDPDAKESIFKFVLEEGIKKRGRTLFSYSKSTIPKYFQNEIRKKELYTFRIRRKEVYNLLPILEKCTQSLSDDPSPTASLQILLDFSEPEEFEDILSIKDLLLSKKKNMIPVSGIIAVNIGNMDHQLIASLAAGIPKIIVSTGKETTFSFAHNSFPAKSVSVVPQSTIDCVIKKSLEPVVLSLLEKPMSGYDIVHEIQRRYKVLIPQARVYTILHDLLKDGYLEVEVSGKSKLFCLTEKGKKHVSQRLNEFRLVFWHILGDGNEINAGIENQNQ